MITQATAERIWGAYREICAGEKLLADMKAEREKPFTPHRRGDATLRDVFGRVRHLELGVPSGDSGHRIFDVAPELAESVIRAHVANKRAELAELNECARIELDTPEMTSLGETVPRGGD